MDTLVFKLVVTPVLIQAASFAARRWGQAVGGWLVGLPLTSGPVVLFLAIDHGAAFAASTAAGSLGGTVAQACFCVAYGRAARCAAWPWCLAAATVAFAAGAALLQAAQLSFVPLLAGALLALALALRFLGRKLVEPAAAPVPPRWDMPARVVVATTLVLLLTSVAPMLGARLSGVLGTYPIFVSVLTVFGHRAHGPDAAQLVLRGLLLGLVAFAGFFFVLGLTIERIGIAVSFGAALLLCLALQGVSLWLMRR
jgi:hypothetical protein